MTAGTGSCGRRRSRQGGQGGAGHSCGQDDVAVSNGGVGKGQPQGRTGRGACIGCLRLLGSNSRNKRNRDFSMARLNRGHDRWGATAARSARRSGRLRGWTGPAALSRWRHPGRTGSGAMHGHRCVAVSRKRRFQPGQPGPGWGIGPACSATRWQVVGGQVQTHLRPMRRVISGILWNPAIIGRFCAAKRGRLSSMTNWLPRN